MTNESHRNLGYVTPDDNVRGIISCQCGWRSTYVRGIGPISQHRTHTQEA